MLTRKNNGLSVYDPFGTFDMMDRMFDRAFMSPFYGSSNHDFISSFGTDVTDDGDAYTLTADLPGFNKDDIKIVVDNGILTVSAERTSEKNDEGKNGKYIRRERSYGSYKRSFALAEIEEDNISAKYDNGVLTVTLPKKEPVPEIESKKTISIE